MPTIWQDLIRDDVIILCLLFSLKKMLNMHDFCDRARAAGARATAGAAAEAAGPRW
jgi:hypothetical protein